MFWDMKIIKTILLFLIQFFLVSISFASNYYLNDCQIEAKALKVIEIKKTKKSKNTKSEDKIIRYRNNDPVLDNPYFVKVEIYIFDSKNNLNIKSLGNSYSYLRCKQEFQKNTKQTVEMQFHTEDELKL